MAEQRRSDATIQNAGDSGGVRDGRAANPKRSCCHQGVTDQSIE
jgi:hypothetical protein